MPKAEVSTDLEEGGTAVLEAPDDETEAEGDPEEGADGDTGAETDGEGSEAAAAAEAESTDGEVIVSIGDPEPAEQEEQPAPAWVKELRKANREKDRVIRQLQDQLRSATPAQHAPQPLGEKPTLASCDYDEEKFDRDLLAWHQRKTAQEASQRQRDEENQRAQQAWQQTLQGYAQEKAALKVPDFEDAEAAAVELLSPVQQGIIINGAKSRAVVMYALGKNPAKAKELAAIADPIKFAFAIADLESKLKVTPRKAAPIPERTVRGAAPGALQMNAKLEALRQKAQKTGDYTEYLAAKRKAAAH